MHASFCHETCWPSNIASQSHGYARACRHHPRHVGVQPALKLDVWAVLGVQPPVLLRPRVPDIRRWQLRHGHRGWGVRLRRAGAAGAGTSARQQ
eukprot:194144-Chlamydomonas_euryale.AAC.1